MTFAAMAALLALMAMIAGPDPSLAEQAAIVGFFFGIALVALGVIAFKFSGHFRRLRSAARLLQTGEFAKGREQFEAICQETPDAYAWGQLAIARFYCGEVIPAIQAARHALSLAPRNTHNKVTLATILSSYGAAGEAARMIADDRKMTTIPGGQFLAGFMLMQRRQLSLAVAHIEEGLRRCPNAAAYLALGHCHRLSGNETEAASAYQNAFQHSGVAPLFQDIRPLAMALLGNLEEVEVLATAVLNEKPAESGALRAMAIAALGRGDDEAASRLLIGLAFVSPGDAMEALEDPMFSHLLVDPETREAWRYSRSVFDRQREAAEEALRAPLSADAARPGR